MTDRELLEAAAKAAGMDMTRYHIRSTGRGVGIGTASGPNSWKLWNPLTDDGDALRLLTKLPFRELYVSEIGATVSWRRCEKCHGLKCDEYASEHNGDLNAATRRAIVRAAAEIGK